MSTSNTLTLKPGTRLRTGGVTYEVTKDAKVPAGTVVVTPQASRLLKVFCETCGYTARITQRWITRAGCPDCPSGGHGIMVVAAKAEKAPVEVEPVVLTASDFDPEAGADYDTLPPLTLEDSEGPDEAEATSTPSTLEELLKQL